MKLIIIINYYNIDWMFIVIYSSHWLALSQMLSCWQGKLREDQNAKDKGHTDMSLMKRKGPKTEHEKSNKKAKIKTDKYTYNKR